MLFSTLWLNIGYESGKKANTGKIYTPGINIDRTEIWMNKMEAENKLLKKQLEVLESGLTNSSSDNNNEKLEKLEEEIKQLKLEIKNLDQASKKQVDKVSELKVDLNNTDQLGGRREESSISKENELNFDGNIGVVRINREDNLEYYKDFVPAGKFF